MEKETDVVVIGAGPAGFITASTAKRYYPQKEIVLLKEKERGVIPCGIPYMISSLKAPSEDLLSTSSLESMGIKVIVDKVSKIDRKEKKVFTESGDTFIYEKLVLATGSTPIVPKIPGINKDCISPVIKDMDYLESLVKKMKEGKDIVVLGGGFIGVEFADEISKLGNKNVYLVEMLPNLLSNSFDVEISNLVKERLEKNNVKVMTNTKALEFIGDKKVEKVKLSGGKTIKADCVILGIGSVPNTSLALDCGLDLVRGGKGIWVDEYMRTVDKNVFAVGDCAGKKDFFTRENVPIMLASTATFEGRIAGADLYQLKVVRENKGTVGVYSTYVNNFALGSAGLTEKKAREEGFDIIVGNFEGVDKHPVKLPGASKLKVKLIFSKHSGIIMGGQVARNSSCGELINAIGIAIQKRMFFSELETLQVATHPYLTSAPTMYPLVSAAQDAAEKFVNK